MAELDHHLIIRFSFLVSSLFLISSHYIRHTASSRRLAWRFEFRAYPLFSELLVMECNALMYHRLIPLINVNMTK
jgi:hypothetical protein